MNQNAKIQGALQLRLDNAKQALLNYLAPVVGN